MRCRTHFNGKEDDVDINLHFPARAVFPDTNEICDIDLVPNESWIDVVSMKGMIDFMDSLDQLILLEEEDQDQN